MRLNIKSSLLSIGACNGPELGKGVQSWGVDIIVNHVEIVIFSRAYLCRMIPYFGLSVANVHSRIIFL